LRKMALNLLLEARPTGVSAKRLRRHARGAIAPFGVCCHWGAATFS
jgi:hypothetical protein